MRLGVVGADDIEHLPSGCEKLVGNEAAVAAPRQGFGAHDGRARVAREMAQFGKGDTEFWREHVARVGCEGGNAPGIVGGVIFLGGTPATQRGKVLVGDAEFVQRF